MALNVPDSSSTVRVRMLDTTAVMTIKSESFVTPVQPGHDLINVTDVAFLIEHQSSGKKLMFDLGTRKDYWNLPPTIQKRLGDVIPGLGVEKDASEILQQHGITLDEISSIIWSHYHWDHVGNPALFPPSTSITVGPGFKSHPATLPGYPNDPKSPCLASDFAGRDLTEISSFPLTIGSLPAHDYFSDGSFYLLDTPGHCTGHICGLARVTSNPSTFIFMGGDICHFVGDFRPSSALPLPDPIPSNILDSHQHFPIPCPGDLFTAHHPRTQDREEANTLAWYKVTDHPRAAYIDPPLARASVDKMQAFDDSPDVLVIIAHDPTSLQVLPTLNDEPGENLNGWKEKGWKERCHWGWLNELPREGKAGRRPIVEGFWSGGERWDREGWMAEQGRQGKI